MSKTPLSEPLTLRLPRDVLQQIETIASASDRTRSWVIVRALKAYLAGEGADILAVVKGREQITAGDVHDMDDVIKEIEAIVNAKAA
ncbi:MULTISPECIES: ribbon-helix-helix protein, CopG family [Rhodopseudomonas]|uniref:CopG family transcriptional regulator n=1 Tax=Rhodopseudomonas palustris TaxID=1076 RepID=A0A0D7EDX0_RHOPL|nr:MULTISPECIES: ribbon-helix-helix protein, CopG family [Rhodopseudomonas]KIZ38943.1 CopG family transcriptional regulator [Rhodopseudomonas palustris]MDF3811824.1 ribbon-helix-helix protein, CopG family [Rhodopseudomonas sp. BAL398]WOK20687.1 ribbon-helix-helix protein, CopG family [Rhodopseudomonas sp. BAL398]